MPVEVGHVRDGFFGWKLVKLSVEGIFAVLTVVGLKSVWLGIYFLNLADPLLALTSAQLTPTSIHCLSLTLSFVIHFSLSTIGMVQFAEMR